MEAETFSVDDLASRAGVSVRTLRSWIFAGILQAPEAHGRRTRYTRDQLVRALVIAQLRNEGVRLNAIADKIHGLSTAQVEALLPAPPFALPTQPPAAPPAPSYPAAEWERIALMPGLELHVDKNGGAVLRQIAQAIWTHYAVGVRRI